VKINHDIANKQLSFQIEDQEEAYSEIRSLLAERMSFDKVEEVKHYNDVEEQKIRSKIETVEGYDKYTSEKMDIYLTMTPKQMDLEIKLYMVIDYGSSGWKNSIFYYAYRSLFHKYLYRKDAHVFEEAMEEKIDELTDRLRNVFD